MIVPLWNVQDEVGLPRLDDVVLVAGHRRPARSSCSCRAATCSSLPGSRARATSRSRSSRSRRARTGWSSAAAGALFEGIRGRTSATGSTTPSRRRRRRRALDREDESLHRQPERVLQPLAAGPVYTLGGPMPGGLPETAVRVDPETGEMQPRRRRERRRGRVRAHRRHGRPRRRSGRARRAARARRSTGSVGRWSRRRRVTGVDNDFWSGPEASYRRVRCRGGTLEVTLGSDPGTFDEEQTVVATDADGNPLSSITLRADTRRSTLRVPLAAGGRRLHGPVPDLADSRTAGGGDPRELGVRFLAFEYVSREDRLRRQPALASADGRRQLRPRLARRARRGRGAGEHEIVAFAPTSPAGRKAIPRALDGLDVELRLVPLPFSQRWRDAWSRLGKPSLERFLGGFDVFHYSDWMYPPQAGGVRATTVHDLVPLRFPEWVTPKTAVDARRQVREHGPHRRPRLRQLRVHRPRRRRAARRRHRSG